MFNKILYFEVFFVSRRIQKHYKSVLYSFFEMSIHFNTGFLHCLAYSARKLCLLIWFFFSPTSPRIITLELPAYVRRKYRFTRCVTADCSF